ncbi:hypothetical protein I7I50_04171 [Histoplasma capsulatum G186AR]|uniref:Uncharacterized protein n=1 Tax=Ajellomyces capsulatus TaxID=5037 RepID=A0A8H7YJR9_AJECA|nr:hypothetical protein I7I52_05079 [Histoplasma capsulatum]QSS75131.1 hypothetical protein I7I50_04171 [Histoplasma capsulatum G186AR]
MTFGQPLMNERYDPLFVFCSYLFLFLFSSAFLLFFLLCMPSMVILVFIPPCFSFGFWCLTAASCLLLLPAFYYFDSILLDVTMKMGTCKL